MPQFSAKVGNHGALVEGYVGVSGPRRDALRAEAIQIPDDIPIIAMIDTGASCSVIDTQILQSLKLSSKGRVPVATSDADPKECDVYDVSLVFESQYDGRKMVKRTVQVVAQVYRVEIHGFNAIIGRDILGDCTLIYNGPTKLCVLTY